ncbi:sensor histidine kinase [Agrilactobacillus fermenti]|uniref:sensor histidine kinase n=1 Tax=Agrilactobacillus fermenti TaxID=2586909 RepID=UPI001E5DF0BC|nr:sensor histidine kinase [Agrilactobacillus fermenti]MCD2255468.1 sensor histidine kinase [Agrilactobacillus fermenti]
MRIKDYLLDHLPHTLFWILGLLLLDAGLWLLPNYPVPLDYLLYFDTILTVLYLLFLIAVYFYRNRWYQKIADHALLREQGLDVPLTGAQNHSQQLIQDHINQLIDYHQQTFNQLITQQQEQEDFVQGWVHDIKVPLAANQLLLDSLKEQLPIEARTKLEEQWHRVNDYVDQVLYFSRLESFANDYVIQTYDLRQLAIGVVKTNMSYFFEKHLQFHISDETAQVLTDEKWLTFILNQLISNAIKYTPNGGKITIKITTDPTGSQLSIQDTGIGIDAADLPRIFDKGFTGKNGRKADQHATGLGLYLAKNMAEKLGHHLSVTATVGKGSIFTILFPNLSYYNDQQTNPVLRPTSATRF